MISIGLLLDMGGVVGLFLYGLPLALSRDGHVYIDAEHVDEQESRKARNFDRRAKFALLALIAGFARWSST